MGINSDSGNLESWINDGNPLVGTVPLQLNAWNHVALTYDATGRTLYVNGAPAGSGDAPAIPPDDNGAVIGDVTHEPYSSCFEGLIDEVSVYDRALTSNEIAGIYAAGSAGKCVLGVLPVIVAQPQNSTNLAGTSAAFSVTATGSQPLSYQWQCSGTNLINGGRISGATTNQLTISSLQLSDAGSNYSVVVTNAYGSTNSAVAALAVTCPAITLAPASPTLPPGTVGVMYNQTISASGGAGSCTFGLTSGSLPAGLGLTNGAIGGKPTAAGTNTFTVTATDTNSCPGSASYTLKVTCPAITLAPASPTLPPGTVGVMYNQTISASGGAGSYSFTNTDGTLPAGLSLSRDGGLGGTPSASGTNAFTVTATDANGCAISQTYTLVIVNDQCWTRTTFDFSTTIFTNWTVTAGGATNVTPYQDRGGMAITVTSTGNNSGSFLPGGSLSSFGGFWLANCSFSLPLNATTISLTYTNLGVDDRVVLMLNGRPIGATGISATSPNQTYQGQMVFEDGGALQACSFTGPNASVSATVTTGFNLGGVNTIQAIINNTYSGIFGGTTTFVSGGDYTSFGVLGTVSYSVPAITLTPPTLPAAAVGVAYSNTLSASGGTGPYSFTKTAGSLPTGLSLSGDGLLRGTPSASGTNAFTVTATDNNSCTGSQSYTLIVGVVPAITVQPQNTTNAVGSSASFSVTATGSQPLSYQWQSNGTNLLNGGRISGANINELTIANVQLSDAGNYQVIVTNTYRYHQQHRGQSHCHEYGYLRVSTIGAGGLVARGGERPG